MKIETEYIELPFIEPVRLFSLLRGNGSILLESPAGPEKTARYSYIVFDPVAEIRIKNSQASIKGFMDDKVHTDRPLRLLREIITQYSQNSAEELGPFQGGLVGLFSYDFVHYIENLPKTTVDDLDVPDAHLFLYDRVFCVDHKQKKTIAFVCHGFRASCGDISDMESLYRQAKKIDINLEPFCIRDTLKLNHDMGKTRYMDIVRRAKEYIRAGDIFQANLSQRFWADFDETQAWHLYLVLRQINPSPFAFFADMGDYKLVSSSPERLIRLQGRLAETRPIAGTRPRGRDTEEDEFMKTELLLNEKERAEHIMLIDLERNDLGKVCLYGTVYPDELMITETYSHVIHIVSNVRGILREGYDAFSLIRAAFPGGTITGVPKVRCMEIIDELEPTVRGPYTGSFGYIGFNGNMDLNIIIRTFLLKDQRAYIQAGAGIVADSEPEREYYETVKKAEALFESLKRV